MNAVEMIQWASLAVKLSQRSSLTGPRRGKPDILVEMKALSNRARAFRSL